MSDPRKHVLPWPFVKVDEPPFCGVEIAPNEIVYVVLAGDYRDLLADYEKLRQAAVEQIEAARHLVDVWQHFGNAT